MVAAGLSFASAAHADVISFTASQDSAGSGSNFDNLSVTDTGSIPFTDVSLDNQDMGPLAVGATTSYLNVGNATTGSFDVTITAEGVTHDFGDYGWNNQAPNGIIATDSYTFTPAPEPAALALLGTGLIGLAGARGRFRRLFRRSR
jgi:hypothetical protein